MSDEEIRAGLEAEARARWRAVQEDYRRALQAWRSYPGPAEADPTAEARDRGAKLGGGQT